MRPFLSIFGVTVLLLGWGVGAANVRASEPALTPAPGVGPTIALSALGAADPAPAPPTTIDVFRATDGDFTLQFTGCQLTETAGVPGSPTLAPGEHLYTGKGTLKVYIAGFFEKDIPSVPIKFVVLSADGHVRGATFSRGSDTTWHNIRGSGVDLTLPKDAPVAVSLGSGLSVASATVSLPFKDADGKAITLGVAPDSSGGPGLHIATSGAFTIHATSPNPTFRVPGFVFEAQSADLIFSHQSGAGNDTFLLTLQTVQLDAPIPGVFASRKATAPPPTGAAASAGAAAGSAAGKATGQDADRPPLRLSVSNVRIDDEGLPTFTDAAFDAPGGGVNLVDLPKLSGFSLDVTHAKVTVVAGKVTRFEMTADAVLPDNFSSQPDKSEPVVIKDLHFAVQKGIIAQTTQPFTAYWNSFGIVSTKGIVLDLSELGDPSEQEPTADGKGLQPMSPTWVGLYVKEATLILPDAFVDKSETNGDPHAKIALKQAFINEHGFTGLVDITPASDAADKALIAHFSLDNFEGHLDELHLRVQQNDIKECSIKGAVKVKDWDQEVAVEVGITSAGAVNATIKTDNPIHVDTLKMTVALDSGAFALTDDGKWQLNLTGAISMDDDGALPDWIAGTSLRFKDLAINSDGHIGPGEVWLTLPDSAEIEMGPVRLKLSELGFGQDADGQYANRFWVGISAFVDVEGSLPITGAANFEGVKIYQNARGADGKVPLGIPDFTFGKIEIDADVAGIAHIHGLLEDKPLKDKNGQPVNLVLDGKPMKIFTGEATLGLKVLGPGTPGIDVNFMLARHSWFVMAGVALPAPIPLGSQPIGIWGFLGGVGYNCKADVGVPMRDYIPIPDVDAIQSGHGVYMVTAGIRLGQVITPPLFWGDVVLTVGFPSIVVDLTGDVSLAQVPTLSKPMPPSQIPADFSKLDRTLGGGLNYNAASNTFTATLTADLNFPTRDLALIRAAGNAVLQIAPGDAQHPDKTTSFFNIGGPVTFADTLDPTNANNRKAILDSLKIQNPAYIKINLPGKGKIGHTAAVTMDPIQAGMNVDFTHDYMHMGMIFDMGITAGGSADFSVTTVKWSAKGTLDVRGLAYLNWHNKDNVTGWGLFRVSADANVKASAFGDHLHADLTAHIEADLGGGFTMNMTAPSAKLWVEGDVDAKVDIDLGWYTKTFHVNPHIYQEVSL